MRPGRVFAGSLGVPLTVVIPAHDEQAVIGACLHSLLAQEHHGAVQVVVVANGCRDATAALARGYAAALYERGIDLDVLELAAASKPAALNAGDAAARFHDRVYLDADVELSPNALATIGAAFATKTACLCSPRMVLVAAGYSATVYARIWGRLPYVAGDVIGAGVYAVRGDARHRWGRFPDIGADDKFVRLHFADCERRVLGDSQFTIHLPVGTRELVRVRGRWIRFNRELRRRFPDIAAKDKRRFEGLVAFLCRNPGLWKDMPAFLLLYGCAEIVAVLGTERERWPRAERARELRC